MPAASNIHHLNINTNGEGPSADRKANIDTGSAPPVHPGGLSSLNGTLERLSEILQTMAQDLELLDELTRKMVGK